MSSKYSKLEEIADIVDSLHKTPEYSSTGYPMIRCTDVKYGRLSMDGTLRVAESVFKEFSRRYIPKQNDIIITRVGSYGNTALVEDINFCLGQNTSAIIPKINSRFLYFVLNSPQLRLQIDSSVVGSTQKTLSLKAINNLDIPRFDPLTENRISEVLGTLDDKIDFNRRINQTLETMAQAIFKSWFVDFDPVKAKIAAKQENRDPLRSAISAISGKTDAELDQLPPEQYQQLAATAALFPDEMEDSELGEIPKGWEVRPIPESIEINPTRQLKKGVVAPYLDMANVPTNSSRAQTVVLREFSSGSKFINGDTLLARITPCLENGKTAFVDFLGNDQIGWGSTEFIVLRPKGYLPVEFAYFLCRHPDFRAFAIAQMAGTSGRQRVPNDCFANYLLTVPSQEVAVAFGVVAKSIMSQIRSQDEASKSLAALRDTLLPKLLSGELDIANLNNTSGVLHGR